MNIVQIKLLVKSILTTAAYPASGDDIPRVGTHALRPRWSLQGLGMLRLYLSEEVRLHVWDQRFAVPGVSTLHTHPWDFESFVVAGFLRNSRYAIRNADSSLARPFLSSAIRCGPGGCLIGEPRTVYLIPHWRQDLCREGDSYAQTADEIHESIPEDGTVTIVTRRFGAERDHAMVYWPAGTEWVSAEPRDATPTEVETITQAALEKWF